MKSAACAAILIFGGVLRLGAQPAGAAAPDYRLWNELLARYYDPAHGMDYAALKAKDAKTLDGLRRSLARVDVGALGKKDQLAYWINLYNVNVVGTVVDHYPVASIRDISTDILIRLNVFKKETVAVEGGKVSLDAIENARIRQGFKDPRIHFAINCAAASCPPIRTEAYQGATLDRQLDDQVAKFLAGPHGVRIEKRGGSVVVHTTKIMDWFGDDFDRWGGGKVAFLKRHLPADKAKLLPASAGEVDFDYDGYDWKLNDWKR